MATASEYLAQLQALLPEGAAWPREPEATLTRTLAALADELARIDARALRLVEEMDGRTALEMLAAWERVAGLPDECSGPADTLQERRAQLVAKLTARGGQSRQFFIDLAQALGFTITITEFRPFRTGISRTGEALYDEEWWHAWRVNAPEETVREFRTGQSTAGEPLRDWGNEVLECVIERAKPAHTTVIFAYGA